HLQCFFFNLVLWESILMYFNWSITVRLVAIIAGGYASYKIVHALFFSPLRHIPWLIPGPWGKWTKRSTRMYGDIYVIGPNAVSISDPSDFYIGFDTFGVENTVSARNPKVASMLKRQLGPYFNPAYISKMEHDILRYGILGLKSKWDSELAQSLSGSIEINYNRDFTLATLDSISALVFGTEPRGLKDNDVTGRRLVHGIHGAMPLFKFFPILNPKTPMDERQIHASSIEMMLAGTGTTSNALQWATHLLMLHPEIRARAVDEVRSNFAAGHVITYADVRKSLPFVEACIYEALRLCPGHFIPEGTEICVSYSAHGNEPFKYDPTRFLDNDKSRSNFLTFSSGVRICSGRHLAWAEVSTILANMLKDYDLSLPNDYTHLGPSVLDDSGYPKLMESVIYAVTTPAHPQRDCRLVLTKPM
ncbi:cytochrome P450, partial [Linderina pennispora]